MNWFCIGLARLASPAIAAGGNDLYLTVMFISSIQIDLLIAERTIADLNWIFLTPDETVISRRLGHKQGRDFL